MRVDGAGFSVFRAYASGFRIEGDKGVAPEMQGFRVQGSGGRV
jgi:hypothetical protein